MQARTVFLKSHLSDFLFPLSCMVQAPREIFLQPARALLQATLDSLFQHSRLLSSRPRDRRTGESETKAGVESSDETPRAVVVLVPAASEGRGGYTGHASFTTCIAELRHKVKGHRWLFTVKVCMSNLFILTTPLLFIYVYIY